MEEKNPKLRKNFTPICILLALLFLGSLALQVRMNNHTLHYITTTFMGLFLLTQGMFKLFELKSFAKCFRLYDLAGNHFKVYGYLFPFLEILLGLGYLSYFFPFFTNLLTLIWMGYSGYGVIKSVHQGFDRVTTCHSNILKLPFSAVSIIESTLLGVLSLMFLVFRI